jgi:hypothetical protein
MVMLDLGLALISLCNLLGICKMRHEMCRISRLSMSCAYALELVVLVESESRACMEISSFSLGQYGPIPSSMSRSSNNDNSNCEIVYQTRAAAESWNWRPCKMLQSRRIPRVHKIRKGPRRVSVVQHGKKKLKPKSQIQLQGQ